MKTIILVDGKNFCHRFHWTHKSLSSKGRPTSILYGCPNGLCSLASKFPETPIVFVWDGDGQTWRHRLLSPNQSKQMDKSTPMQKQAEADQGAYGRQMLASGIAYLSRSLTPSSFTLPAKQRSVKRPRPEGYKAHRESLKASDDGLAIAQQIPILKKFLRSIGIRNFEVPGLEGDDLIGILMKWVLDKQFFDRVIICSSDKDFYQFIGKQVRQLKRLENGKPVWADPDEIMEKYGVDVKDWTKLHALIGEPTDNIPHLFRGLGPKTAVKWLKAGIDPSKRNCVAGEHQLSVILKGQSIDIAEHVEAIRRNYKLCEIVTSPDFPLLAADVRYKLKFMLDNLTVERFYRNKNKLGDDEWQAMTEWMMDYEMLDLMGRRKELWELP